MLGKLIKHEFRATRRNFSILLAVMLGITLLMKPLFWIRQGMMDSDEIQVTVTEFLVIWAFFMMISILTTAAEVMIAIRYYQSMTCDEAYLTFTLPVTPTQIIWSKVLVGGIWYFTVFLISILCIVLAFAGTPFIQNVWPLFSDLMKEISVDMFAAWGLELILAILSRMMLLICVIGIGQLFGKYRFLGSIGSYFIINVIMTILLFVVGVSTGIIVFSYTEMDTMEMEQLLVQNPDNQAIWGFILNMVYALILGCGSFLGARHIFSKKLNLE